MDAGFWKGKRVLLTGHTGFKGSWLTLWLQSMGSRVMGLALPPPTQPSLFEAAGAAQGIESINGDIRDLHTVKAALCAFKPEIVLHLAAQSVVRASYDNPVETYDTNVMGTVHVLEAVRQTGGVKAVVVVTSDKCYDNKEWAWGYRETDALGGFDPYSNSKGCTELVAAAYRDSFFSPRAFGQHGVALGTARAGNVIGGGDWTQDQLVPDVMRAVAEKRPVLLRSPGAVRPWQFVLEPLDGYLRLAQSLYQNGPQRMIGWNFGPRDEDAQPVRWLVERICAQWGPDARWSTDSQHHPHEAGYLKLDSSMARTHLGWRSRLDLEKALEWTVEWYRAYQDEGDMRALTLDHIQRYMRS